MPSYGYLCERCGNFHSINTITERNKTECPKCGRVCERDIDYELNSGSELEVGTDHPRWSWSMAVPPSQLPEFRKRYPDITFNDRGQPLIKNRKDKLRQMKKRDFMELS